MRKADKELNGVVRLYTRCRGSLFFGVSIFCVAFSFTASSLTILLVFTFKLWCAVAAFFFGILIIIITPDLTLTAYYCESWVCVLIEIAA